jgi:uncharacterized protein YfdQ (DUF2303 family)
MADTPTSDTQAVITAARQGAKAQLIATVGSKQWWLVPGIAAYASRIEAVETEKAAETPARKRGSVTVFDAASFSQVLDANGDVGDATIYVDRDPGSPSIVAVLNGHGIEGPGWGDFRVQIEFRETPQWAKWKAINGKMLAQADFAEFIEENAEDITTPSGAEMLEIATYLDATRTVNFRSGIRLPSGQIQFQNMESIEAKVSAGQFAIPETFELGIAPFLGVPIYKVPVRFRYRLQDGKLTLGVKLQRVESMMVDILNDVVGAIERSAEVPLLEGLPPAALA